MSEPVAITFVDRLTAGTDWTVDGITNCKHPPGAAEWSHGINDEISSLMFSCPCGCRTVAHVPVKAGYSNQHWQWNGSLDRPTLTPSIQRIGGCRWHGWLTDGKFVTA